MEQLPSPVQKRLRQEIEALGTDPIPGISVDPNYDIDDDLHWHAIIFGPPDTPYENGIFHVDIHITREYPLLPPKFSFKTKILHPNIDSLTGYIGLDVLHEHFSPALTISTLLLSVQVLLTVPNGDAVVDCFDDADLFRNNRDAFNAKAREWTLRYAC